MVKRKAGQSRARRRLTFSNAELNTHDAGGRVLPPSLAGKRMPKPKKRQRSCASRTGERESKNSSPRGHKPASGVFDEQTCMSDEHA